MLWPGSDTHHLRSQPRWAEEAQSLAKHSGAGRCRSPACVGENGRWAHAGSLCHIRVARWGRGTLPQCGACHSCSPQSCTGWESTCHLLRGGFGGIGRGKKCGFVQGSPYLTIYPGQSLSVLSFITLKKKKNTKIFNLKRWVRERERETAPVPTGQRHK